MPTASSADYDFTKNQHHSLRKGFPVITKIEFRVPNHMAAPHSGRQTWPAHRHRANRSVR